MKHLFIVLGFLVLSCAPSNVVPIDAHVFAYFEGEAVSKDIGNSSEISLVTWNVLGLPDCVVATRPWRARIDGMAKTLLDADADVIVLQEAFEPDLAKGLFERLKGRYAHAYLHLNTNFTGLASGLAVISKFEISDFRFTPHPYLLHTERWTKMGMVDFCVKSDGRRLAHIATAHFQGGSRFSWRKGLSNDGSEKTFAQTRQSQSQAIINTGRYLPSNVPRYVCGDFNVDRRDVEYMNSALNPANSPVIDPMSKEFKLVPTSTSFFKHVKALWKNHPGIESEQLKEMAAALLSFKGSLQPHFESDFWQTSLTQIDPAAFEEKLAELKKHVHLKSEAEEKAWEHFMKMSLGAYNDEMDALTSERSTGNVTVAEIVQICGLPFDEALDYVLGIGKNAHVSDVQILRGYDLFDPENTFSDHHPIYAKLTILRR